MSCRTDSPRISVVIPCYNREDTIVRAVESALAQLQPPHEVIVVDDGSMDRTCELVQGLGGPIQYVFQANSGPSSARNRGVDRATGEWIAFLDSDDFWYPEHLMRVATAIRATGARAPLYFSDLHLGDGAQAWSSAAFSIARDFELNEDASSWAMLPSQPMMWPASVVRRRDYLDIGGLWEALRIREDTHFYLKLCLGRPACAVAGFAGEATADVDSRQRLSLAFGPGTAEYWLATVLLYEDICDNAGPYPRDVRSELRRRLAGGHLRLARQSADDGRWWRTFEHLLQAGRRDPRRLGGALLRLSGRRRRPGSES